MPASDVEELLQAAIDKIRAGREFPATTYRLQFHAGFTFGDAARIIPYLHALGITHVYASPILRARVGSTHGYDVIDPESLNPELGGREDFEAYVAALAKHGMGQIVDIVPNHMGVGTNDNAWWSDCLENGPGSRHAQYFDIDWQGSPRPELNGKVLLPVLGQAYGDCLEEGKLRLTFDAGSGVFEVAYYDRRFPLSPGTYGRVLRLRVDELRPRLGQRDPKLIEFEKLAAEGEPADLQSRLALLLKESEPLRAFVDENVAMFNGTPGIPRSFDLLDDLLSRQFYRLAFWRTAPDEINYRRFFDITDLAALRTERAEVFEAIHTLTFRLLAEGKIAGLRIDHPDGLFDPEEYFLRLQRGYVLAVAEWLCKSDPRFAAMELKEAGQAMREWLDSWPGDGDAPSGWPLYVVAEKILAADEPLPADWAIHGTTGYDFINKINGLFVDPSAATAFTQRYHEWIGSDRGFDALCYEKKRLILEIALAGELEGLTHQLDRLAQRERHWRDFTLNEIREGLREMIACFPVYRSYICRHVAHDSDARLIETATSAAVERNRELATILRFIGDVLLLKYPEAFSEENRAAQRAFVGKFQQLTAPVTAKGVEDTAFYIYNRLVSLNEVGGDPQRSGTTPELLHQWLGERGADWPLGLSPLSTHDTKRSEDVRARLNVLSEFPDEWWQRVARWSRSNEPHRRAVEGRPAPDLNDELLIYQTLVGVWPIERTATDPPAEFIGRIQQYMLKAMREAKVHTRWTDPNPEYERAVDDFVAAILSREKSPLFLQDFRTFQRRVSQYGLLNSLSQTLLRLTAPGVPDTYQGTELWDFSLVDPDNRRPVDYESRRRILEALASASKGPGASQRDLARDLIASREDGRAKLFVTWRCLTLRRDYPQLFSKGEYLPVEVVGERRDHVFSFIRRDGDRVALIVVPRFASQLGPAGELPLGDEVWGDTALLLPEGMKPMKLRDRFTGELIEPYNFNEERHAFVVSEILSVFPVALVTSIDMIL